MLTSLTLSYISTKNSDDRLFEDGVEEAAEAEEPLFEDLGTVEPETATEGAGSPEPPPPAKDTAP
jgi:hypothetical protein